MKLSYKRGRGNKIHIYLDEEYEVTTDIDFWNSNYFSDGQDISRDEFIDLYVSITKKKAVDKCYDLLSRRNHSEKELRDKLLRNYDEDITDYAINKMYEFNYLDDQKYAKELVVYLVNIKKYSKRFVQNEMYKRGLSSEIINDTISNYDFNDVDVIVQLLDTKYRYKIENKNIDKVIASLQRKGFSFSDIKEAFSALKE